MTNRLRLVSIACLSAVMVAAVATACFSNPKRVDDPPQDLGPTMDIPLDIKRVTQNHDKEFGDQDFITFEIEMQEPFNDSALRNIDDHFAISFHIDIDRNGLFDRVIAIDTRPDSSVSGEAPFAMVTRRVERASFYWEVGLERILAFGQVRRPTDSSFAVRFPARLLGKDGPRRFAWAARAVSRDRSDPQGVGFDYVPNSGTTSGHSSVD